MLVHNIIKTNYVREGYLPNYPYHLISDKEMFNAFINNTDECYFKTHYPCIHESLKAEYDELINAIQYHIDKYIASSGDVKLPDWVYSYMMGEVVSSESSTQERHEMLVLMNLDNLTDEMTKEVWESCLEISNAWVRKLPPSKNDHRPPTMFGEPHVIKSLRLLSVNVLE